MPESALLPDLHPSASGPRVSLIMITLNVESKAPGLLARVLQAAAWVHEMIIVDAESTDGTAEIARRFTPHVITQPWLGGFRRQKEVALRHVTGDWVLWLDADELMPSALAGEIQAAIASPDAAAGYRLRRVHYFVGKPLLHCGLDAPLRLWRRGVGGFTPSEVHEVYEVPGPAPELPTPLAHYSTPSIQNRLERFVADAKIQAAYRPLPPAQPWGARMVWRYMLRPALINFKIFYWNLRGYRDGVRGLVWAATYSLIEFYIGALVWQKSHYGDSPALDV